MHAAIFRWQTWRQAAALEAWAGAAAAALEARELQAAADAHR